MATFRITMKDPDYAGNELSTGDTPEASVLGAFLEYNEYITIEFDTRRGTARVIPTRELRD